MTRLAPLVLLVVAGCAARPDSAFEAAFAEAVPICELRAYPENYLGRTVLVRGRFTGNLHGSGLWLEECRSAWTDLRGSSAVTEDPKAARILNRLAGGRRNEPNEVVYRGMLQSEPRVTGEGGKVFQYRYWFQIERLVAARPAPPPRGE